MKKCTKCEKLKPLNQYNKGNGSDSLHSWCKNCNYTNRREWNKANPERNTAQRLYAKYRLRPEELQELLDLRDNKCEICSKEFTTRASYHIDHDHSCCFGAKSCGQCIRGILCAGCNTKVWWYELHFYSIAKYLDKKLLPRVISEKRKNK